jgi:NitT/TauT family transport system permease protein
VLNQPFAARAEAKGGLRKLFSLADQQPNIVHILEVCRRQFVDDNPQLARAYVHDLSQGMMLALADREALLNIADSIRRMLLGFTLALLFAVPTGLLMGRSRLFTALLNPLLMIVYPIPKAALMPIIMLWLGVGDASKTLVIFLGVSLPVIYHSQQGARAVAEKMLWSAAAMGMTAPWRLLRVVLPAALPEVFAGARTGLVLALITMVTSEMIARQAGVGNLLFNALDMAQYDAVYASILIISVLGFCFDLAFERLRLFLLACAEPAPQIAVGTT